MIPLPVWPTAPTVPASNAISQLVVRTRHNIRHIYSHVPGVSKGSVVYFDLNGYGWYDGSSGMITHNRGRKGLRRTARGIEDGLGKTSN
ncbi:MAG: hypothetical protein KatS3mg072_1120 [Meiothermus sp.]|uniref:Uncharacterized protein n=2 Tax=Meiothermus hypogaeus TaxID=884155 RepID=A0A511R2R9_9DEIN|nr:hypothetical protein Mhypo_02348 [Meiothermus hypogaeus]GEM83894.1 hypothetical protein MHY01S_20600 [Meiothermus hypogaeus NBRC 106114]GIW33787.1 MAG: hypothetical protein KatS3mg072_1120 [Meiothermus sp.]